MHKILAITTKLETLAVASWPVVAVARYGWIT